MAWQSNSLYTTNPSIEVTTMTTDRWSVDFSAVVQGAEVMISSDVTVEQLDPPTHALVAAFAGTVDIADDVAIFDIDGSVLTAGYTYLMKTAGTLNTGKVVVLLTAVICVC